MTNFEKIKQMSVEEFVSIFGDEFICELCSKGAKYAKCDAMCSEHFKEWLESEVEE